MTNYFVKWNLADYANLAQVLSVPLAIVLWFFTKEQFSKFWKNCRTPVFILLAIVALAAAWRLGWFHWLSGVFDFFKHPIPLWVFILTLALIFLGFWILRTIVNAIKNRAALEVPKQMGQPQHSEAKPCVSTVHFSAYVNDTIFGIRWSWNYRFDGTMDPTALIAFCPNRNCGHRLDVHDDYERASYMCYLPISLHCPRCGFVQKFDCRLDGLQNRVAGEIERRINTGEYLRVLLGENS